MPNNVCELTKKNLLFCMTVVKALAPNNFYIYKDFFFLKGLATQWVSSYVVEKVLADLTYRGHVDS